MQTIVLLFYGNSVSYVEKSRQSELVRDRILEAARLIFATIQAIARDIVVKRIEAAVQRYLDDAADSKRSRRSQITDDLKSLRRC